MQTFLPVADFQESARILDNKRLGKQRVEAKQILNVLTGVSTGWRNHPAVKMWAGCVPALRLYTNAMIHEWIDRGFNNTMLLERRVKTPQLPWWFGNEEFHRAHQSNLLRKDPVFYGRYAWNIDADRPYWWPVKQANKTCFMVFVPNTTSRK